MMVATAVGYPDQLGLVDMDLDAGAVPAEKGCRKQEVSNASDRNTKNAHAVRKT